MVIAAALLYVATLPGKDAVSNTAIPPTSSSPNASTTPQASPATNAQQSPMADSQPGTYRAYDSAAVASTKGAKLIFFHAPWCPQCRSVEASIEKDGLPSGVTVFKADYDSSQALRQKYGVTIQTTFVKVDDAGNKLGLYVAYEEPQFSSVKRNLLDD